ncbi:hypothetical protein L1987_58827 [Smallanthus sonchifolius]|uniref:Uncharacterized protein n=1 Tax=Smallanthus sonchifolius TaxID=185202 RepID=A0ACB9D3T9_9ASTR|nr:hypothetical protein L1987_58827 [Smallanthus sonchifolius]
MKRLVEGFRSPGFSLGRKLTRSRDIKDSGLCKMTFTPLDAMKKLGSSGRSFYHCFLRLLTPIKGSIFLQQ